MNSPELSQLAQLTAEHVLRRLERLPNERLSYTMREAAEVVGLPRSTLDDARSRGEFKAVKRCSRWMVTRAELLRWLSDQ